MMKKRRHLNYRLVKIHRSYTAEEIAALFGIHKNTVRHWVKEGLTPSDNKRPMLILGHVLADFLKKRRAKNKQTCKIDELYCVRCRSPQSPAGNMAEYEPVTEQFGNLKAICPKCENIMNKRVSSAKIGLLSAVIDISFREAGK